MYVYQKKIIKNLNCDLENWIMEERKKEIISNELHENNEFFKCIEITDNFLAVSEESNQFISIWNLAHLFNK